MPGRIGVSSVEIAAQIPASLLEDLHGPFYDVLRDRNVDAVLAERMLRDFLRPLVTMVPRGKAAIWGNEARCSGCSEQS